MIRFEVDEAKLILRSPTMPISQRLYLHTTWRRAMNGKLYGYKKTPATVQVDWNFANISRKKLYEVVVFLKNQAGKKLTATMYREVKDPNTGKVTAEINEELWIGHIINRHEQVGNNVDMNSFQIQFEGFQYPVET